VCAIFEIVAQTIPERPRKFKDYRSDSPFSGGSRDVAMVTNFGDKIGKIGLFAFVLTNHPIKG